VEKLERSGFQCILLDYALPGGGGVAWVGVFCRVRP
jgi:hypothetical protein